MKGEFPKSESETPYGSPTPLTPTTFRQQLIPKPPGEVSRVGRGGYTLKDILEEQHGWINGLYDKIRERVRSMADRYLDTTTGYSSQTKEKVDRICEMASEEFPILLKFEGNWVVHDYLRVYLKNSSQKAKKDQQQKDRELEAAAKGKGKAKGVSLVYTETTGGSNLILRSSSQITG